MIDCDAMSSTVGIESARTCELILKRLDLPDDTNISVYENACSLPGFPPIETVIVIHHNVETKYRFKIFKLLSDVGINDLPEKWLLPSLLDDRHTGCKCC